MKITKLQIVILLLVFWAYTRGGGSILPLPKPDYIADLRDEDLDSKVLAAMIVIADDHKPKVLPVVVKDVPPVEPLKPVEDEVLPEQSSIDESELFPGRYPRAIVLTNTVSCPPCRDYDRETLNIFKTKSWQSNGWSIGSDASNVIEIVDLSKEEEKFYDYFDKLSSINKDISPSTPTTIFVDMDGTVKSVKVGKISHSEFVRLCKPEVAKASTLDTMSHKDMVKLHNEFHGGGNWKWPGNLKSHLAVKHGVK